MKRILATATVIVVLVGAAGYASVAPTRANAASVSQCADLSSDLTATVHLLNAGRFGVAAVGFRHLRHDYQILGKPNLAKLAGYGARFMQDASEGQKLPAGTFKLIRRSLHYMKLDRAQTCGV
jgi:hypothetical protein